MKILITGCAGFIGYHICEDLLKKFKKISIIGIDNINDYYSQEIKKKRIRLLKKDKKFHFIKTDISNKDKVKKVFSQNKFDIVVHMAAQAGVRYALVNPESYLKSNIEGFLNILDNLKTSSVKKFIFASSSSVYGEQKKFPLREKFKPNPINIYSSTKLLNEQVAKDFSNISNVKFVCLRFFTVYGILGRPDMFLFKLLKSIFQNKKFYLNNNGNHQRDFTHIDDVKNIIYKLIKKKFNNKFQLFNVCSNKSINLRQLITEISKLTNLNPKIVKIQKHKADVLKTHGDNTEIVKFLNLKYFRNIIFELPSIISWYKKNKFYKY